MQAAAAELGLVENNSNNGRRSNRQEVHVPHAESLRKPNEDPPNPGGLWGKRFKGTKGRKHVQKQGQETTERIGFLYFYPFWGQLRGANLLYFYFYLRTLAGKLYIHVAITELGR